MARHPGRGPPATPARVRGCAGVRERGRLHPGRAGDPRIPVYEIYKVGADPHWVPGLDLLRAVGLDAVVVPHYDNAEGGTHDTRYCYLGERRLRRMESELPDGTWILGVDEHTACAIDLAAGTATVTGRGAVTVRHAGHEARIESGAAVDAAFLLEEVVDAWREDLGDPAAHERARGRLRAMIGAIGELADEGLHDHRDVVAPYVDALLDLREAARDSREFETTGSGRCSPPAGWRCATPRMARSGRTTATSPLSAHIAPAPVAARTHGHCPGTVAGPRHVTGESLGRTRTGVRPTHEGGGRSRALRAGLVGLAIVAVLAAPVLTTGGGSPPEATLRRLSVDGFTAADDGSWVSDEVDAPDVVLVGAAVDGDATVEVRAHDGEGWGPWLAFPEVDDHGPDQHRHDDPDDHAPGHARHEGDLDPLWVGPSERLQLRARSGHPGRVRLDTVVMPPDRMLANQPVTPGRGAALASTGDPQIIPRAAWDPDGECRPTEPPESGVVEMAHIHHTVMYPTYAPEEADDVVRALCLFHVEARGFSDLGYNFMVDAYGRVYEGRAGGIDRAVVGSHAAGFNHVSAGISVMGDHETDPVSDETIRAIEELLAWLFTTHRVDPLGTAVVESTGGAIPGLTRFEEGEEVELPTIVGHKDTGNETLCPGRHLYAAMEDVPARVADLVLAAAQNIEEADEPPDVRPRSSGGDGGVVEAGPPAAGPALAVTGWGGIALGLLTLGAALLAGERRWRVPEPPADRSGRDPAGTT